MENFSRVSAALPSVRIGYNAEYKVDVTGLKIDPSAFATVTFTFQKAGDVANVVEEDVTGVRVVKGFGQEARELDRAALLLLAEHLVDPVDLDLHRLEQRQRARHQEPDDEGHQRQDELGNLGDPLDPAEQHRGGQRSGDQGLLGRRSKNTRGVRHAHNPTYTAAVRRCPQR